jgi:hypothetical protein
MSRVLTGVVTILVCGVAAAPRTPSSQADVAGLDAVADRAARRGLVRVEGRALRDDDGLFNPLGASLFWLAWGYKFDRARLERNLRTLADAGVDYVRGLGDVGPSEGWADREVDPGWADHASVIAGATDLAYDRYGLRVQWTIFGGGDHATTPRARAVLVDRFADMARGRAHKLLAIEIANEAWQNGFEGAAGRDEIRALGRRLAAAIDVPVALTAPAGGAFAICPLYARSSVDLVTVHYSRGTTGAMGPWAPVGQPAIYETPAGPGAERCRDDLPRAVLNNEPIGPASSGEGDRDPLRLAVAYVTSFASGSAGYVLHAGPGIRGGGTADLEAGRAADFSASPDFDQIARALAAAKQITPAGLANWTRVDLATAASPFSGLDAAIEGGSLAQALVTARESDFFAVLLGLDRAIRLRAERALSFEVIDPATAKVLARASVDAGGSIAVPARLRPGGDGLVLRGRVGGWTASAVSLESVRVR